MAIDFSKYVYQPRPLQQWNIGEGLNDIIQANQEKARLGQQESQYTRTRSDTQATTAAEYATKRGDELHGKEMERYDKQRSLVNAATTAAQKGDWATARALLPRVLEMGGEASESGSAEAPVFRFKASQAPGRAPLDFRGARDQIYGGAPSSHVGGQPFQVPGFGADGKRNPFDPSSAPGAGAAALPPSGQAPVSQQATSAAGAGASAMPPPAPIDAAGPPPGAAIDGPRTPPPGAVWLPPDPPAEAAPAAPAAPASPAAEAPPAAPGAQAPQPGSPQLTGPNPFNPDPYTIDTSAVMASNKLRLDPVLKGIADASGRYKPDVEAFGQNLHQLRLGPEETLKAAQPWFGELAGLYRGQMAMEGQSGRVEAMRANQQAIQDNKDRADARAVANKTIQNEGLAAFKKNLAAGREAKILLEQAHQNPNVANSLIESLYRMKNTGVMTDKDFDRASKGVVSLWGALKNGTLNQFFQERGGFNGDMIRDLNELIQMGSRASDENMKAAARGLYEAWKYAPTQTHKQVYDESMRIFFPEEYRPDEFKESWEKKGSAGGGDDVPVVAAEDEQAMMEQLAAQEGSLGVVDVPEGRHPSAGGKGAPAAKAPPPPKRILDTKEVDDMSEAELEQALKEAKEEADKKNGGKR